MKRKVFAFVMFVLLSIALMTQTAVASDNVPIPDNCQCSDAHDSVVYCGAHQSISETNSNEHTGPNGKPCTNIHTESVHIPGAVNSVNARHTVMNGTICYTVGVFFNHEIRCSQCGYVFSTETVACYATHSSEWCPKIVPYCYAIS